MAFARLCVAMLIIATPFIVPLPGETPSHAPPDVRLEPKALCVSTALGDGPPPRDTTCGP